MVVLRVRVCSLLFIFKTIALWSNSEFCSPGSISQEEMSLNSSWPTRKKSIRGLFLLSIHLGLKEKSLRVGKKRQYGSVRLCSVHRSLRSSECLIFGSLFIFKQSKFVSIGSVAKVQFQSPPKITSEFPSLIRERFSL